MADLGGGVRAGKGATRSRGEGTCRRDVRAQGGAGVQAEARFIGGGDEGGAGFAGEGAGVEE